MGPDFCVPGDYRHARGVVEEIYDPDRAGGGGEGDLTDGYAQVTWSDATGVQSAEGHFPLSGSLVLLYNVSGGFV
jgi:hypothetical protein